MMTAIRINKMGKAFETRQAARNWAKDNGGQVVDMAKRVSSFVESQMLCDQYHIANTSPRWIVMFDRIICTAHVSKLIDAPYDRLGKTVVISKRRYQSMLAFGKRIGRLS